MKGLYTTLHAILLEICTRTRSYNTVCKVFDVANKEHFLPNFELYQFGSFQSLQKEQLTSDGRCVVIKYPYIEGNHEPKTLSQFAGTTSTLHKLHLNGFVHGDVRLANITFSEDDSHSVGRRPCGHRGPLRFPPRPSLLT